MGMFLKDAAKTAVKLYISHFPVKVNDYWLFMNPDSVELVPPTVMGKYEQEATALFKKIIQPGWTIVDVGAYIGYFTILSAELTGKSGSVLAFEPNPLCIKILKRNLNFHNIANVQVYDYALGNKEKISKIYLGAEWSSMTKSNLNKNEVDSATVKVKALDKVLGDKKVDFIKMDIQGHDFKAFQGAKRLLQRNKDIVLHLELWPKGIESSGDSPIAMLDFLKDLGFAMWIVGDTITGNLASQRLVERARKAETGYLDLICARKSELFVG